MKCELCSRRCRVDRKNGETGFCGMTEEIKIARVAPHYWEEPCISGKNGSGTVFFSGCNLRCVYCQNAKIAAGRIGKPYSVLELSEAFLSLQERGCHNINLVTPSHYIPQIAEALKLSKLKIPVVYNTSSYETVEALQSLNGLVDIYLADLKYLSSELSLRYSHAADYPETAKAAIAEMVRQTGGAVYELSKEDADPEEFAELLVKAEIQRTPEPVLRISNAESYPDGALMKRGVIIRHLLLPGQTEEAKRVVNYVLQTYGNQVAVSLMNQYTPLLGVAAYPELNRKVTTQEYEEVVDYALDAGLSHGFIQEGETAEESFIPEFSEE